MVPAKPSNATRHCTSWHIGLGTLPAFILAVPNAQKKFHPTLMPAFSLSQGSCNIVWDVAFGKPEPVICVALEVLAEVRRNPTQANVHDDPSKNPLRWCRTVCLRLNPGLRDARRSWYQRTSPNRNRPYPATRSQKTYRWYATGDPLAPSSNRSS